MGECSPKTCGWLSFSRLLPALLPRLRPRKCGPRQARHFIAGKFFSYNCFDGTNGNGRIYADGSVAGYIQPGGSGPRRFVVLPANTLQVKGDRFCAAVRGLPFEPCFNLSRTSQVSFRGAVSGLGFAYCDFHRRSTRADLVRPARRDVRAEAVQRD